MFKIILSAAFLFQFTLLKAQETNVKKTEVVEHREGNSQESKKQLKQVKNETQAVPKPIDSARTSAKINFGVVKDNHKKSDERVDSLRQLMKEKVPTKNPQQTPVNKPATQQATKQGN